MGAALSFFGSTVECVGTFLRDLLLPSVIMTDIQDVHTMDAMIMGPNGSTRRTNSIFDEPADGFHWYWPQQRSIPILCWRRAGPELPYYELFGAPLIGGWLASLSQACRDVRRHQEPRVDDEHRQVIQPVKRIVSLSSWNHQVTNVSFLMPKFALPEQKNTVQKIMDLVERHRQRNVCNLLLGETGKGKSKTARFLARAMQERGYECMLIEGFNPCQAGLTLDLTVLTQRRSPSQWLILLIDEIDIAMEKSDLANADEGDGIPMIAANKASFCNFLDFLIEIDHLIVIATSNSADLQDRFPIYCRRFHNQIAF